MKEYNSSVSMTFHNTKRPYCTNCHYPLSVCICEFVQPVPCNINIWILQHPKEVNHAKNSARLLPLCLDNVHILCGEVPKDFEPLITRVTENPSVFQLFYPSPASAVFEHELGDFRQSLPDNLIFIDATWRKALKMWHQNLWLHNCPAWKITGAPQSSYVIRKTPIEQGISTLDAVAYVLKEGYGINSGPLHSLFEAMQSKHYRPK